MNIVPALLLLVFGAGCATSARTGVAKITPPVVKSRLAEIPFSAFRTREQIILAWDDCAPQPEGAVYQVCDKTDLADPWALYAETSLRFLVIPTTQTGLHIFAVRVRWNEIITAFAGTNCPPSE